MTEKYTCIVCGRKFPKGQGVIIEVGKTILTFHSTKCTTKFFRLLVERVEDTKFLENTIRQLVKEIEEQRKKLEELRKKKI